MYMPSTSSTNQGLDAHPAPALLEQIRGAVDDDVAHETSKYTWWSKHEGSTSERDRTFRSRRLALLYVAKRNSEQLCDYAESAGTDWEALFPTSGTHVLRPNRPFDLHAMLELGDDAMQEWCDAVCNAFSRYKVVKGSLYRYQPRPRKVVEAAELYAILQREGADAEELDHTRRQALLLSDIAGFD